MIIGFLLLAVLVLSGCQTAQVEDWSTPFELSGGNATPRYDETVAYCRHLAGASEWIHFTSFGRSPQDRDLPLLVVDKNGNFTPRAVRDSGNAVILIEACIHSGECCGKDAGLMLVRDMTVAKMDPRLLNRVTVLFIPIFNVDGHERFGPYGRINQNGPKEMGWRTTAQNLNLNRDFLKADAPEMRAWLRLFTTWLPDFFVDIHSTDGADYQYPITYAMEIHGNMDADLTEWCRGYIDSVTKSMAAAGFPLSPYVSFRDWHDPRSGLESYASGPRYSQGYAAVQNRPGLLVEAHMLKDYETRVRGTLALLKQTLKVLNEDFRELRSLAKEADARTASHAFREEPFALSFETLPEVEEIDFLGVEYDVVKSDLTGGDWVRWGDEPLTFRIPHYSKVVPKTTVKLPEAYLVPPECGEVIDRLELHGVEVRRLRRPARVRIRTFRFDNIRWEAERPWHSLPYEGRHLCRFDAKSALEEREFPAGTAIVDMNQRAARVAAHILEPSGPDSFVHWGFFNTALQRVEYVESYVIEEMARKMLAEDPELKAAFENKKEEDKEFASNPWAIRDWFYRRTPYYDDRAFLYPVGFIDERDTLASLPR